MTKQFSFVILADGDYPSHPVPLGVLSSARRLICCDHAAIAALQHGLQPFAVVGDGDSLSADQKSALGPIYHQVDEQDYNDLTKALRHALSHYKGSEPPSVGERIPIAFLGATGKREDHTLCNISLMMWYYRNFPVMPILYTDFGLFTPATGKTTFRSFPRQQVSIFNADSTTLSSQGLRWSVYPYRELWQGGLNEALGTEFTLDSDGYYTVFQTYDAK